MTERLLEVTDLKTYFYTRDGVVKAVDGVSFTLDAGETLAIVGESGSGKSVTVSSVMRLIPEPPGKIEGGEILFKGESVLGMSEDEMRKMRGNRIAMIFQDPMTSLNPVYRVGQQIAESLQIHRPKKQSPWTIVLAFLGYLLAFLGVVTFLTFLSRFSAEAAIDSTTSNALFWLLGSIASFVLCAVAFNVRKDMIVKTYWWRAVELLDMVGIPNAAQRAKDYPHQFSGGMRQRAMIAMALSCDPDILVADEPTTALDVTIQAQIMDLMMELKARTQSAVILITHDLGVVADVADRVMVMYAGRPVEYGAADEIFYRPEHPYTWGLLDSLPRYDIEEKGQLCPIEGQPPSLIKLPSGCPFHPRCPYAGQRCSKERPELQEVSAGHYVACLRFAEPGFERGCSIRMSEGVA